MSVTTTSSNNKNADSLLLDLCLVGDWEGVKTRLRTCKGSTLKREMMVQDSNKNKPSLVVVKEDAPLDIIALFADTVEAIESAFSVPF